MEYSLYSILWFVSKFENSRILYSFFGTPKCCLKYLLGAQWPILRISGLFYFSCDFLYPRRPAAFLKVKYELYNLKNSHHTKILKIDHSGESDGFPVTQTFFTFKFSSFVIYCSQTQCRWDCKTNFSEHILIPSPSTFFCFSVFEFNCGGICSSFCTQISLGPESKFLF